MSLLARGGDPLESGPKAMFIHRRGPLTTWAPRARQPEGPGEFVDRAASAGSADAPAAGFPAFLACRQIRLGAIAIPLRNSGSAALPLLLYAPRMLADVGLPAKAGDGGH